ncbi:unnamed protein product [Phytomonas sp. Hart1]|nr:unnamed protein product [Phytomonas sp. Hart1]|eukprot:CCW72050.1 unnamed protein product [Phytomonas sp. isolate Hart1]
MQLSTIYGEEVCDDLLKVTSFSSLLEHNYSSELPSDKTPDQSFISLINSKPIQASSKVFNIGCMRIAIPPPILDFGSNSQTSTAKWIDNTISTDNSETLMTFDFTSLKLPSIQLNEFDRSFINV